MQQPCADPQQQRTRGNTVSVLRRAVMRAVVTGADAAAVYATPGAAALQADAAARAGPCAGQQPPEPPSSPRATALHAACKAHPGLHGRDNIRDQLVLY